MNWKHSVDHVASFTPKRICYGGGGGGFLGTPIEDFIAPVAEPILQQGPNAENITQAFFAPSTLTSENPGILGAGSRVADTAVASYFGGPAGAAGASALNTGIEGGSPGDIVKSGILAGAGAAAGGALSNFDFNSLGDAFNFSSADNLSGITDSFSGANIPGASAEIPPTLGSAGGASPAAAGVSGGSAITSAPGGTLDLTSDPISNLAAQTPVDTSLTDPLAATSPALPPAVNEIGVTSGQGISPNAQGGTQTFGSGAGSVTSQPSAPVSSVDPANPLATGNTLPSAASEIGAANLAGQEGAIKAAVGGSGGSSGIAASLMKALGVDPSSDIGKSIASNSNLLVPAVGLALSASRQGQTGQEQRMNTNADRLDALSQSLTAPLFSGKLPPGAQGAVDQATASAKAAIRSKYASMGMSGSSSEQADLANVDRQAATQVFQLADQLLQQGISVAGLDQSIYQALIQDAGAQNTDLMNSIAGFATAAAGGTNFNRGGVNINLGKAA